jgi:hypothetical protein
MDCQSQGTDASQASVPLRDLAAFSSLLRTPATTLRIGFSGDGFLQALYRKEKGLQWHWPLPGTGLAKVFGPLLEITYPIAISELLWGTVLLFTRSS